MSNDVRRFDDAGPFWIFLWAGPLELVCVLLMVSLQLGFLAALGGVSTLLLLIPVQVCALGRFVRLAGVCAWQAISFDGIACIIEYHKHHT